MEINAGSRRYNTKVQYRSLNLYTVKGWRSMLDLGDTILKFSIEV